MTTDFNLDFKTDTVKVNIEGRVATVELNRPESMNALDLEMIRGLAWNLKELCNSDDVEIVVLKGSGRAFSAGGDIKTMLAEGNESDFLGIMDSISELIITLYSMPKVTISAITGAAAGLGFSLALATDYIIADPASKLAMNFIGIGLIPDGGGHFFMKTRVGETKAKHLIWEGKPMSAAQALELGLIDEVAQNNLNESIDNKVKEWEQKPLQAMIKTKKIYAEENRVSLLKFLELEKIAQTKMRQTEDHKEGIQAFLEKRKPNFIGK
ncbi:Enoyl-CoA hydratase/carnithine racemase [Mesobacillus persicus]|uniref:Enoyl-CoA hydratase/carnithine racemase n=1 Tax=Mesobacillus persicus TaxID=930146 RepID=A0A1H8DW88_9BACI|nr:enoyl-CoA hydratase [Mesobacillus persicus]SEN11579.1 Enoyl-CoA hydratase/carnithine racemase [Mesobacillus persicus]